MAKEKTYTHEQVEKLIEQAKANIEQLKNDVSSRETEIVGLKKQISNFETKEAEIIQKEKEVERKSAELEAREAKIAPKMKELSQKQSELVEEKAKLDARELSVVSQEKAFEEIKNQLVAAGAELAQKKAALFSDAEKLANELQEKRIAETEKTVQSIRNNAQMQFDEIMKTANEQAQKIRDVAKNESERIISDAKSEAQKILDRAASDTANLEKQISDLTEGNAELSGKNTKLAEENALLSEDKHKLSNLLAEQKKEFDATTATYAKTMASFETLKVQLESNGKNVAEFTKEIAGMDTREQELNARENDLNERDRKLLFNEKRNENKLKTLEEKEADIDAEVESRYPEIIADKDREIETLKKETESLRNSLFANTSIASKFDDLTAQFGGKNPADVLLDYQRIQQDLSIAMEKVNNTPSYALQKTAADLHDKENSLAEREAALAQKERESQQLHDDYLQKQAEVEELTIKNEQKEKDLKIVKEQLDRLRSTYENPAERDDRILAINTPLITESNTPERMTSEIVKGLSEQKWLSGINKKIEDYGLHFPRRILHAFHTALKTSEMSPLTVLSGVSGTGKSELPRLYSRFGGINFLGVPVQPNWDCQEAMLGYYNSIDNCFEATDILRLLAQSQRKHDDQNGLDDVMTMILLDEMNLANVELYFAEFLSKLETRRGLDDSHVPYLGVKIGSKMPDWQLKLGRNVLWTGTMNNDETTKTLSDKVLDRGIVINFPRPKKLIRSKKEILGEQSPLLPRTVWSDWVNNAYSFTDEQIGSYKEKVEQMNEQLGRTGRALGHRVWQSIESYMSLYPDVISAQGDSERTRAMDNAFEDQLVQKIMPKLRGIEVRGEQGEVLDAIEGIIPESLREDYENAKQGYGQFIWTTSGYLLRDDVGQNVENAKEEAASEQNPSLDEENPIVKEALQAISDGTLKRTSMDIKKFLEDRNQYGKDLLHKILNSSK